MTNVQKWFKLANGYWSQCIWRWCRFPNGEVWLSRKGDEACEPARIFEGVVFPW